MKYRIVQYGPHETKATIEDDEGNQTTELRRTDPIYRIQWRRKFWPFWTTQSRSYAFFHEPVDYYSYSYALRKLRRLMDERHGERF